MDLAVDMLKKQVFRLVKTSYNSKLALSHKLTYNNITFNLNGRNTPSGYRLNIHILYNISNLVLTGKLVLCNSIVFNISDILDFADKALYLVSVIDKLYTILDSSQTLSYPIAITTGSKSPVEFVYRGSELVSSRICISDNYHIDSIDNILAVAEHSPDKSAGLFCSDDTSMQKLLAMTYNITKIAVKGTKLWIYNPKVARGYVYHKISEDNSDSNITYYLDIKQKRLLPYTDTLVTSAKVKLSML